MTLTLTALILLIGTIFFFAKGKSVAGILAALAFSVFLFMGTDEIPKTLLGELKNLYQNESYPNWMDKNLIILFGMATMGGVEVDSNAMFPGVFAHSRIFRTAHLYRGCIEFATGYLVFISNGDPQKLGAT